MIRRFSNNPVLNPCEMHSFNFLGIPEQCHSVVLLRFQKHCHLSILN
uniref:Uncharacterized protein n=1 Tax=Anguilla anguilla TaxID=7936 RepID=A0A0E9PIU5_ANGAN